MNSLATPYPLYTAAPPPAAKPAPINAIIATCAAIGVGLGALFGLSDVADNAFDVFGGDAVDQLQSTLLAKDLFEEMPDDVRRIFENFTDRIDPAQIALSGNNSIPLPADTARLPDVQEFTKNGYVDFLESGESVKQFSNGDMLLKLEDETLLFVDKSQFESLNPRQQEIVEEALEQMGQSPLTNALPFIGTGALIGGGIGAIAANAQSQPSRSEQLASAQYAALPPSSMLSSVGDYQGLVTAPQLQMART